MSTDVQTWVRQSLQGDQQAFGKIVAHYQSAVSATAYSVTGNLAQSEDLAQEAFLIAWQKLGSLKSADAIASWLCGITRNLARDWVRKQSKRPIDALDENREGLAVYTPSPEEASMHQERADVVWGALAEIPETYREPIILFYRQGESIRAIAEILELSEDAVKQRLSRGRKLLRAEVETLVEATLTDTRPGKAFTLAVVGALPALYGAKAGATEMTGANTTAAASTTATGMLWKLALPVVVMAAALGTIWVAQREPDALGSSPSRSSEKVPGEAQTPATAQGAASRDNFDAAVTPTVGTPARATPVAAAAVDGVAVTGIVVFRGGSDPAPGMKVLFGRENIGVQETISDEAGRFSIPDVVDGEYVAMAYDGRYGEMPEDDFRSAHYEVSVADGVVSPELRIEVPPSGATLTGRITDGASGAPLAGIEVEVIRMGEGSLVGKSGPDGQYHVLGVATGSSWVRLASNNSQFSSDSVEDMDAVVVPDTDAVVTHDITVDRGIPVAGRVVDEAGEPVADARVSALVFRDVGRNRREDCFFRADEQGVFTVWGALAGNRLVLSARIDDLASPIEVVRPGEKLEPVTLVVKPMSTISGRFVDEEGRPVAAKLWNRPMHPDGPGQWTGSTGPAATTFTTEEAQGDYELKGQTEQHNFGVDEVSVPVSLGPNPVTGLTVVVATMSDLNGAFTLRGKVVDEAGQPLRGCRVYIRGTRRTNQGAFQETYAGSDGRFAFENLLDDEYNLHATPGEPYVDFAGFDNINPAETPEVTIVVRNSAYLHGRVVDGESGEPITQFEVECGEIHNQDRMSRWGPEVPNVTSATGEFSVPARLDKPWYLQVSAAGYAPQRVTGGPLTSGENTPSQIFKLVPGRVARGVVVDGAGNAVPDAKIYLQRGFEDGPTTTGRSVTETDSQGRFEVTSIADDETDIYAWKGDHAIAFAPIGDDMRIVLTEGGVVEGRVTVGGAAPTMALHLFASLPDTHFGVSATITDDGAYRFEKLMDKPYRLQVTLGERGATRTYHSVPEMVDPRSGEVLTLDIDVPFGESVVAGRVLDGGLPVAGADLRCRNGRNSTNSTTSETGEYRFEGLTAGPVTITLRIPGEVPSDPAPYATVLDREVGAGESIHQDLSWPG